jgi:hypothetical protein
MENLQALEVMYAIRDVASREGAVGYVEHALDALCSCHGSMGLYSLYATGKVTVLEVENE